MSKKTFSSWVDAINFVRENKGSYIAGGITEGWFVMYYTKQEKKSKFFKF